jgi:poly-gamma-glutamate synthesis protein (capsule biosynthesis protein)
MGSSKKSCFIVFFLMIFYGLEAQVIKPWSFQKKPNQGITILLLGDTNIQNRENPESAFAALIPTFEEADLKFINLEGPFAGAPRAGESSIPHKDWSHSDPNQVKALTSAGIDGVGVANNVTYPWQDMVKSAEVLSQAGIPSTGGGMNKTEAQLPIVLERKGIKVAFVQYATTVYPTNHAASDNLPGIAGIKVHTAYQAPPNLDKPGQPPIVITWLDEAEKKDLSAALKKIKEKVDILIFSVHWGISGSYEPVQYQHELGRLAIESGADVVMGHGTHRYQMVEMYQGKPIFHGLAQGVFDDIRKDRSSKYREGILVRLLVENKRLEGVSLVPIWRGEDETVRLMNPAEGKGEELFKLLKDLTGNNALLSVSGNEIQLTLPTQ